MSRLLLSTPLVRIRQQRDGRPQLPSDLLLHILRVKRDAQETNIERLEIRVILQIHDLLRTVRSAIGHVEIEQDRPHIPEIGKLNLFA